MGCESAAGGGAAVEGSEFSIADQSMLRISALILACSKQMMAQNVWGERKQDLDPTLCPCSSGAVEEG